MRKWMSRFLLLFGVLLFLIGGYLILAKFYGYKEADATYKKIEETVVNSKVDSKEDPEEFTVDWEALKNFDVVAWIRMGDKISYPVVQGNDNSYYLHHLYNEKSNYGGSIFLHYDCEPDFTNRNSIIYGHNMRNGSMFGSLKQYLKKKDNPFFYIYLPDGTMHAYQICSASNVMDGSKAYTYQFATMDDFVDYQNYMLDKSEWDTGVKAEIKNDTKLVSLSTCSSFGSKKGHRVMIQGIEKDVVQIQEPASWYEPVDHEEEIVEALTKK